ncbi:tetratricopeptide repeat protein [Nocardia sp. alder85J]|uniref:tetratricopeptide repeat protein n=1 Tax=Nocardia sp. alder85J TaxID=2862949 RepID=UPI001CD24562|nr:tetratricopeptide repeat protein [Nocardia sp. alder85J]MCX4092544.1 tetratricopeptide repeat protein [Nocardia sp. alder85J]
MSAVDLTLTVTDTTVRLCGAGIDVGAAHAGLSPGLSFALAETRNSRDRDSGADLLPGEETDAPPGCEPLRRAAALIATSFLPDTVAQTLWATIATAESTGAPLRLGIEPGPFGELPWEAAIEPARHRPLALHPNVTVYRKAGAAPAWPEIPGPLRILVAVAAPDTGGDVTLNYENELLNVLAAVRNARRSDADIRIVEFATTDAIRAALEQSPAHILHISGHGEPGYLVLEDEQGAQRPVTAAEFAAEAIPAGLMPPVIALSACYTSVAGTDIESVAAGLVARGANVVIGTEASVSDRYATAVFADAYRQLAQSGAPDVVAAVSGARRAAHDRLATSTVPDERQLAALDEWSVVTILAATAECRLYSGEGHPPTPPPPGPPGPAARARGEFFGRRREQRLLPAQLASDRYPGIVLHGIGGIGKTALATELVARQRTLVPVTIVPGHFDVDSFFRRIATAVGRHTRTAGPDRHRTAIAAATSRVLDVRLPWNTRLKILREQVFPLAPVVVLLDDFEENLDTDHRVADDTMAHVLAAWIGTPGPGRLLITTRYRFTLPDCAEAALLWRQLGPLTLAETYKVIWSLPTLDRLATGQFDQVWRLLGGHPRSLEYLDALLAQGRARYADTTARLAATLAAHPETHAALDATADLDTHIAATITLISNEILLADLLIGLSPAARHLLLGMSVYREPVDNAAALCQIGDLDESAQSAECRAAADRITAILTGHNIRLPDGVLDMATLPAAVQVELAPAVATYQEHVTPPYATGQVLGALIAECTASSLISVDPETGHMLVHRGTAAELADHSTDAELRRAHHRAGEYWRWRARMWRQDRDALLHDQLEARHHYLHADDLDTAMHITEVACGRLSTIGAQDRAARLARDALERLAPDARRRGNFYYQLGTLAQARMDYDDAEHFYTRALAVEEKFGNRATQAICHRHLGELAQERGDVDEAVRRYIRALAIADERGLHSIRASVFHRLGLLAEDRRDYREARHRYSQALSIFEGLGDHAGMANAHGQLGTLATIGRDYDEAERRYTRALAIAEEIGDRRSTDVALHQLGVLAQQRGRDAETVDFTTRALAIAEEGGDRHSMALGHHNLGILARDRGDHPEAERRLTLALALHEGVGDRAAAASTRSALADVARARGQLQSAVSRYAVAFRNCLSMNLPHAAHNLGALVELHATIGCGQFVAITSSVLREAEVDDIHRRVHHNLGTPM